MLMMFYLNVFYLPTLKQVVGQYKMWNQVMFWFTQMMCYNVYIPLLIRQANDVEENPGPTIFDIIDPIMHQGLMVVQLCRVESHTYLGIPTVTTYVVLKLL